jgi:hypothetical protein
MCNEYMQSVPRKYRQYAVEISRSPSTMTPSALKKHCLPDERLVIERRRRRVLVKCIACRTVVDFERRFRQSEISTQNRNVYTSFSVYI